MVLLFDLLDLWKEKGGVTRIFSSLGNSHFHNTQLELLEHLIVVPFYIILVF